MFQGNKVTDESAEVALFAELGSAPANMEAGKALDAYGAMPGNDITQGDGKQAYTQALMKGVETWIRLPKNRWPASWKGKFRDPVVRLILALYGHPDSGGLWERHCESCLLKVGFRAVHPECWPSMYWHAEMKLLLGVYVDDFKMAGPAESHPKGWEIIGTEIDMDKPEPVGRYLGCEHLVTKDVTLKVEDHPFAHVFDKSLPDPAAKSAAAAHRAEDYWTTSPEPGVVVQTHVQPRKRFPETPASVGFMCRDATRHVCAIACTPEGSTDELWLTPDDERTKLGHLWTGETYHINSTVANAQRAVAAVKAARNKHQAKKAVRAQGFTFLQDLEEQVKPMTKKVSTVQYDMRGFLQQCLDRYRELAPDAAAFKKVATPFHEERIARPVEAETEPSGRLQSIASKVLMKVLFAARMARYDFLRATQGLASRVTKWSPECDVALHRLMCYIASTLGHVMVSFVGDEPKDCKLWLFADADHAGEHDSRSTTGCVLALVGPNTYFPLTAFSKKQTSTAMSSTEAEVVAANLATRSVGLPSSCLR